jgi:MFS family permease
VSIQKSIGKNPPAGQAAAQKTDSYPIRALIVLTATVLLVSYVETMILPGIPIIEKDLSTTVTIGSWITAIVLLVGAVVSPIFGKLGDLYGKKKTIIITLVFYTVGVSIAGFSTSIYFLLFARAIQGVGLAIIPLSLAYLTDIFPKDKLATAQGAIAGSAAISTALGLVVGAYVVQDLGWQYAFHTAAILSVVLFAVVAVVLRRDFSSIKCKIDYVGALLLSLGIALILLYTTEGSTLGWLSLEEVAFLIPGLALTVSFFYFESKAAEPLIQLNLLRIRNVLIANLVTIIAGLANFLLFFAVVTYSELATPYGLGFDIIHTGLTLAPGTIVMFIVGPLAGRLVAKAGPKPVLVTGAGVSLVSYLLFIFNRGASIDVTINVMVAFAGLVSLFVPIVNIISVSLPKENVTVGQGLNATLKLIGSAVGPVLTTTILASYTVLATKSIHGATIQVAVPSATAFNIVFALGIALSAVTITLSLLINNGGFKNGDKG